MLSSVTDLTDEASRVTNQNWPSTKANIQRGRSDQAQGTVSTCPSHSAVMRLRYWPR